MKIGDKVKIIRKPTAEELEKFKQNSKCSWVPDMDSYVGTTVEIFTISTNAIQAGGNRYYWPHQAFEEAPKKLTILSKWEYLATDPNGNAYLYSSKPTIDSGQWRPDMDDTAFTHAGTALNVPESNLHWKNSLHKILPNGTLVHITQGYVLTINGKDVTISKESLDSILEVIKE